MKKKLICLLLCLTMLLALAAGCAKNNSNNGQSNNTGNQTSDTTPRAEQDLTGKKAGVILPTLSNDFMVFLGQCIREGLEGLGMTVEVVSADEDPAKQLEQLENFERMGIDTIVMMPLGASAGEIGPTLKKLSDGGMYIVTFGNKVDEGSVAAQILVSQQVLGEDTARAAAAWIDETFPDAADGSVEVAIVATYSSEESKVLSKALEKVAEYTSKATIAVTYERDFSEPISKVQEQMDMMLVTNPNVKAVLTYDCGQALVADEVIMRSPEIDKATFGIFTSSLDNEAASRIASSIDNSSVLRYTNTYGGEDGTTFGALIQAAAGTLELDENGIYYFVTFPVNAENARNFMQ